LAVLPGSRVLEIDPVKKEIVWQCTGVNPFEFGLIGGSDYHNGLARTSENDLVGQDASHADVKKVLQDATSLRGVKMSSAGLAGVWAESNTREAIFDALYRRETFATSGTRPRVRFFAGFHYAPGITKQRDWIKRAYERGRHETELYAP
jgi:hypothetical protein